MGKKLIATFLMISMLFCMSGVMANDINKPELYISVSELGNYSNHEERVNACQLNEILLTNMSTSELVDAILEYPYLIDIYAFNDYSFGYENVRNSFNGLQELERRSDAGVVLMEKYRTSPVDMDFLIFPNIEVIVSQQIFTKQLSEVQNRDLVAIADSKYLQKCSMSAGRLSSARAFYEIATTYSIVSTPNNSTVFVYSRGEELEQYEKEEYDRNFALLYPHAVRLSSATTNYNCHSYAWYLQSTSNTYWMNDPSLYMINGSYTKRTGTSVSTGDRIYYANADHTAIANFPADFNYNNVWVTSKWGPAGLYRHLYSNAPYATSNMKTYYR